MIQGLSVTTEANTQFFAAILGEVVFEDMEEVLDDEGRLQPGQTHGQCNCGMISWDHNSSRKARIG